jgi:hypothetical protein
VLDRTDKDGKGKGRRGSKEKNMGKENGVSIEGLPPIHTVKNREKCVLTNGVMPLLQQTDRLALESIGKLKTFFLL